MAKSLYVKASRKHAKREKETWLLVASPSPKAYSTVRVVGYYRSRMQIEEGLRDTKSKHYGLDFVSESRIEIERQIKVNSNQNHSSYSVIFLARIACRYLTLELSISILEQAQALLVCYFDALEEN